MLSDLKKQAKKIIDIAVNDFLKAVNSIAENGHFRKNRRLQPAFELLRPANDEFYEYAYFERSLEWYTRDILINQSLMELFHLAGIDCLWPEKKKEVRFSNESIENIYPFEFIVLQGEKRIGYRYTGLCENEVDDLIKDYQLDRIVQIDWKLKEKTDEMVDSVFTTVSFGEFLEEYFPFLNGESIVAKFKKTIKEANDDIGFDTIPRLSLRYLSNFKNVVEQELKHTDFRSVRYMMIPESKSSVELGNIIFSDDDYKICDEYFVQKGLYKALMGNESFAKCFITAEYNYQVFKQGNNQIDYTSVVSGYLKSIEQLLYKLLLIRTDNHDSELWIKCKSLKKNQRTKLVDVIRQNPDPNSNATQILVAKNNERYFDITMNPLVWFVHDDINGWSVSDDARRNIHMFLRNYADECRNGYFHKDNIDCFEVARCIRNNTIFIMYLLLGSYQISQDVEESKKLLGIQDDSFDRLYKIIQEIPRGIKKFVLKYEDGKTIKAYRYFYQEDTRYDSSGSVSMSRIKFVLVDDFSMEIYDAAMSGGMADKEFYIEKDNIPSYVAYINGRDEEVQIDF